MTRFLAKFFDSIEPEACFVELIGALVLEFRLELVLFLEMLLKVFQGAHNTRAGAKRLVLFRKAFDLLEYVFQQRLMLTTPGAIRLTAEITRQRRASGQASEAFKVDMDFFSVKLSMDAQRKSSLTSPPI